MTYITENIIAMGFPAGDMSSGFFGYVEVSCLIYYVLLVLVVLFILNICIQIIMIFDTGAVQKSYGRSD